ncbi:MAG TPA: phosphatidate cytidylyltransferase [Caldithrix sp.]|nr:phosphatidate cytidylyltransferase [Calditrichaceae bacterium]HEM49397.1 phosphatidate cytidylyltransferase [Caldithrix sp.]
MGELSIRILVALLGIPLLLFVILQGDIYFFSVIVLIAVISQWEMYKILQSKAIHISIIPGYALGILLLFFTAYGFNTNLILISFFALLFLFAFEMFRNKGSAILNIAGTLLGIIYPVAFLAALLFLRFNIDKILPKTGYNPAGMFIITMFASIWLCDTFAYFFGKALGKHRLFERVSPKKSIEGAIAGLIGAILIFFISKWIGFLHISNVLVLICGIIVGTLGQLGDLVESWFKRDAGVKDSSSILPGHGGMLDRFDSLMFIAPAFVMFYLLLS